MPAQLTGDNPYLSGIWDGTFNYNVPNPPAITGSWDIEVSRQRVQTRLTQVRGWRTTHLSRPHDMVDGDAIIRTPNLDKAIIDLGVKIEKLEMRGVAIGQLDPLILRPSMQSKLNHIDGLVNKLQIKKANLESERNQRTLAFRIIAQRLNEAVTILESYPE